MGRHDCACGLAARGRFLPVRRTALCAPPPPPFGGWSRWRCREPLASKRNGRGRPSGGVSTQERGYGTQAGLGLLVETVACEVPLDTNQQQLIARFVPIARGPRGEITLAQLGHLLETA